MNVYVTDSALRRLQCSCLQLSSVLDTRSLCFFIRPHRGMVCLSLQLSWTRPWALQKPKPIRVPFGFWTRMGTRNHALGRDPDHPSEWNNFGGCSPIEVSSKRPRRTGLQTSGAARIWRPGEQKSHSGVQGQSPWSGGKAPWSWKHFGHWMSNGAGKFSPFSQI